MTRTALIAGQGALPRRVAQALAGTDWFACHLDGALPEGVGQSRGFRLEGLGSFIAGLKNDGVDQVVFAGRIVRPSVDPSRVDAATQPLLPRITDALQDGDDGALRALIATFEDAGLTVVAPQDLDPSMTALPLARQPSERDLEDIARAVDVHGALSPLDVGQGVVVAQGQVLAIEAAPGTDFMLATLAKQPPQPPRPAGAGAFDLFGGAADWLSGGSVPSGLPSFEKPAGGVFFKAPKLGQDRRIDLPVVGPDTIRRCAAAGLNGLALEDGGVLVLEPEDVAAQLRSTGLFLSAWSR
ncbi:MAG: UDP-2,3-diacylglucosamine diphosphatase LpxI [Pseudomonadota bacterium]